MRGGGVGTEALFANTKPPATLRKQRARQLTWPCVSRGGNGVLGGAPLPFSCAVVYYTDDARACAPAFIRAHPHVPALVCTRPPSFACTRPRLHAPALIFTCPPS